MAWLVIKALVESWLVLRKVSIQSKEYQSFPISLIMLSLRGLHRNPQLLPGWEKLLGVYVVVTCRVKALQRTAQPTNC